LIDIGALAPNTGPPEHRKNPRSRTRIAGLREARLLDVRPPFIPQRNVRGSRRAGLVYEAQVAKALTARLGSDRVIHGPWIEYEDNRGRGWCQPDLIVLPSDDDPLIIGECKLTATQAAERKLRWIYLPCVEMIWPGHEYRLVQICRSLSRDFDDLLIEDLNDTRNGPDFATWRFRGC